MPLLPKGRDPRSCADCQFRSLRMFCNLDMDALQDFERIGTEIRRIKGATLFREGELGEAIFVLCNGQVKLSCASREGKTLILKIAMAGDVLGLGAIISGAPYEVTAQTLRPCEIRRIARKDFLPFLQKHGQASLHAAKALSAEYKAAFFDARRLALSGSAAGRLAGVLLEWGRASACGSAEMRFTMALTHEELANMVGSSRETVTRMLGRFKQDKLIAIRGSSIQILSPGALEEMLA